MAIASDPFESWDAVVDRYVERRERLRPRCHYRPDQNWEAQLHDSLQVSFGCDAACEFGQLWPEVIEQLKASGIRVGPQSFGSWNDGDRGLVRAIWCLVRHLKPTKVIETGVGHGVTSRFILEALERNGNGFLWSIDRQPTDPALRRQVGIAVRGEHSHRWSYVRGNSRRQLPKLLSHVGQIELFVHDSLHSERNVRFELDRAWESLKPGGALVIDDIDANWGFQSFTKNFSGHRSWVCEAEPLYPDLRRFNQKGLFGIILKD
jgi:hypothetical protein